MSLRAKRSNLIFIALHIIVAFPSFSFANSFTTLPWNSPDPFDNASQSTTVYATMQDGNDDVFISIYDGSNAIIKRLFGALLGAGSPYNFSTPWDGKKDDATLAPYASYTAKYFLNTNTTFDSEVRAYGPGFNSPTDVYVDSIGNVYSVNAGDGVVQKISKNGTLLLKIENTGLANPRGVAVDASGKIYVSDTDNDRIVRFDSDGANKTVLITLAAGARPWGLDFEDVGGPGDYLYVALNGSKKIEVYRVDTAAFVKDYIRSGTTFALSDVTYNDAYVYASETLGFVEIYNKSLSGTSAWLVDRAIGSENRSVAKEGNCNASSCVFYVSSYGFNKAYRVQHNRSDNSLTTLSSKTFSATWKGAYGIGVWYDGANYNVFVVDILKEWITKNVASADPWPDGTPPNFQTDPYNVKAPNGVTVDSNGNVYVTAWGSKQVKKFDRFGNHLLTFGSEGSGAGQFLSPSGVAVDASGNIYVSDTGLDVVKKFDSLGNELWSKTGGGGLNRFDDPEGMVVTATGKLLVANTAKNRVAELNTGNGNFVTFFQGSAPNTFSFPTDVDVDAYGNIYVLSMGNDRIYKCAASYTCATWWTAADFGNYYPFGLAVDAFGRVWYSRRDTGVTNDIFRLYNGFGGGSANPLHSFGTYGEGGGLQFSNVLQGPYDVSFDDTKGFLWITDTDNNRLVKVKISYDAEASDVITIGKVSDPPKVTAVNLSPQSPVKATTVTFTVTFSEAMDTNVAPDVKFQTADSFQYTINPKTGAGYANGYKTSTTHIWEGTASVPSGHDGAATVIIADAQDAGGTPLSPNPDSSYTFTIDSTPPADPTVYQPETPSPESSTIISGLTESGATVEVRRFNVQNGYDAIVWENATQGTQGIFDSAYDTIISGNATDGLSLLVNFTEKEKHVDNGATLTVYDSGEAIVNDANGNGVYDTGEFVYVASAPPAGTPLVAFRNEEKHVVGMKQVVMADNAGNFSANNITLEVGMNYITAISTDKAGNSSAETAPRKVRERSPFKPGIASISPANDRKIGDKDRWTITYTASDDFTGCAALGDCYVTITVPPGWVAPTETPSIAAYVTITEKSSTTDLWPPSAPDDNDTITISGQTITVNLAGMNSGDFFKLNYGDSLPPGGEITPSATLDTNIFDMYSKHSGETQQHLDSPGVVVFAGDSNVSHTTDMPADLYKGYTNIKVMSLTFKNQNPSGSTHDYEVKTLTLTTKDNAGAGSIAPSSAISKVVVKDLSTTYVTDTTIETTGSVIFLDMTTNPVVIPAGGQKTVDVFIDVNTNATAATLQVFVNAASDIVIKDKPTQTSITASADTGDSFPMSSNASPTTSYGNISALAGATNVKVKLTDVWLSGNDADGNPNQKASKEQTEAIPLTLTFRNPDAGTNGVNVWKLTFRIKDQTGANINPSSIVSKAAVYESGVGYHIQTTSIGNAQIILDMSANPINIPASSSKTVDLRLDILSTVTTGQKFKAHLAADDTELGADVKAKDAITGTNLATCSGGVGVCLETAEVYPQDTPLAYTQIKASEDVDLVSVWDTSGATQLSTLSAGSSFQVKVKIRDWWGSAPAYNYAGVKVLSGSSDLKFSVDGALKTTEFSVTPNFSFVDISANTEATISYNVIHTGSSYGALQIDTNANFIKAYDVNDASDAAPLVVSDADGATNKANVTLTQSKADAAANSVTQVTASAGQTGILVLDVTVTNNQTSADPIRNVTVKNNGTASDSEIANVRLYYENDATPGFSAGDTQSGTAGPFSSGVKTFSAVDIPLPASGTQRMYVAYDVSATVADKKTLDARMDAGGIQLKNSGATLESFVLDSATDTGSPSKVNVVANTFKLEPAASESAVGGYKTLAIKATDSNGNVDTDSYQNLTLYLNNASCAASCAGSAAITSTSLSGATPALPSCSVNGNVTAGEASITITDTVQELLNVKPSSGLPNNPCSTVDFQQRVSATANSLTGAGVAPGTTGKTVLDFTLTNGTASGDTINTITIKNTGTATNGEIAANGVSLVYDADNSGTVNVGDTTYGPNSFVSGSALFTLNQSIAAGVTQRFLVTYNLNATLLTDKRTLDAEILSGGVVMQTAGALTDAVDSPGDSWIEISADRIVLNPSSATAGNSYALSIYAQDANANLDTDSNIQVQIDASKQPDNSASNAAISATTLAGGANGGQTTTGNLTSGAATVTVTNTRAETVRVKSSSSYATNLTSDITYTADSAAPSFAGLSSAASGNQKVTLTWTNTSDAATGGNDPVTYNVYRRTASSAYNFSSPTYTTTTSPYDATGLTNGIVYYFIVRAKDAVGNNEQNTVEKNAKPTANPGTDKIYDNNTASVPPQSFEGAVIIRTGCGNVQTAYLGNTNGTLYALEVSSTVANDATERWVYTGNSYSITSMPNVYYPGGNPVVIFGNDNGQIYAVEDACSSAALYSGWSTNPVDPNVSSSSPMRSKPIVANISGEWRVFMGDDDNKLYCLKAADGANCTVDWNTGAALSGYISTAPSIVGDGYIYVGTEAGKVHKITVDTASVQATFPAAGNLTKVTASPSIETVNARFYFGAWDKKFYAVNYGDMSQQWAFSSDAAGPALQEFVGTSWITFGAGNIYVGNNNGVLYRLNGTNGSVIWRTSDTFGVIGAITTMPVLYNNVLYFGADDGKFYAVRAADGTLISGYPYDTGAPIKANAAVRVSANRVYVANTAGQVFSFPLASP